MADNLNNIKNIFKKYAYKTTRNLYSSNHNKKETILVTKTSSKVSKSFAEEIANDQEKSALYINRATEAITALGADNDIAKQEVAAVGIYKRALLLIGAGNIEISDNNGNKRTGTENNLPASSYLSHGSRIMIEIPPDSGNILANWLSSGDANKNGMSLQQTQKQAISDGKIVYNRSAATHDVNIKLNKDKQYTLEEKKGFLIGAKDFAGNMLGKVTKHFGVDLALGAKFNGRDSKGNIVKFPDGEHGHLYIHYTKPTKNKPGSMLIGIESAAPTSAQHSKTGAANITSPVGGAKYSSLANKQQNEQNPLYKNTIIPKTIGGMNIKLNEQNLNNIVKLQDKDYGTELAYVKPGTSVENFQKKLITAQRIANFQQTQPVVRRRNNLPLHKPNNNRRNSIL